MPAVNANLEGEDYARASREWLLANLPDQWRLDAVDRVPPTLEESKAFEAKLAAAGLAGMTWPVAYGGHGRSMREHMLANREIGRLPVPESVNSIGKELAGPIIMAVASEEQKQRWLPNILNMSEIWCQGFSEPEAGSDLAGLRTRAVRDGKDWRITGQKIWTSGGWRAQRCLLLARTGSLEDRHKGLAMFAIKLDQPGVTVRTIKQITGVPEFCEVFYDNALVEEQDVLGGEKDGWPAAVKVLEVERATNRMYRAWRIENELRHLVRACMGDARLRDIVQESHFAQRLAAIQVDVDVLKAYVESVVEDLANGESIGGRGSLMKLHWSEAHQRLAALALELLDKAAQPPSPEIAAALRRFRAIYLYSRAATIYAGTSQIQMGIIADRILRLPRGA